MGDQKMKIVCGLIAGALIAGLPGTSCVAGAEGYYLQQQLPESISASGIKEITFTFFDSPDGLTPITSRTYFSEALSLEAESGDSELRISFEDVGELAAYRNVWVQMSVDDRPIESRVALAGAPTNRISLKSDGAVYIDVDRGADELGGIVFREDGDARAQWIMPFFRGWQNDNLIFRWDGGASGASFRDVMFLEAETGNVAIGYDNGTNLTNRLQVDGDVLVTGAMKTLLPEPAFDSGWQVCTPTLEMTFAHAVNVPQDNMLVDFQVKDGANIRSPTGSANYWTKLTSGNISVNCTFDEIRIRIWAYK
jgi:hypothetical protein